MTSRKFKQTEDGGWTPTFPSDPEGQEMGLMDIEPTLLRCPPVGLSDFMQALSRIKPSVNFKDIIQHVKWTEEFGQDG